jgi:hypothetical protein
VNHELSGSVWGQQTENGRVVVAQRAGIRIEAFRSGRSVSIAESSARDPKNKEKWARLKLTDQSLEALQKERTPDEVLVKLKAVLNKELQQVDFEREVDKILTADEKDKFQSRILHHAEKCKGWYAINYLSGEVPIELITYSHNEFHSAVLVPLSGVTNHSVSPVLLGRGEPMTPAYALLQISTYEIILGYFLQLAHVLPGTPSASISISASDEARAVASNVRGKLEDLLQNLPDGALKSACEAKVKHLIDVCQRISRQRDGLFWECLVALIISNQIT